MVTTLLLAAAGLAAGTAPAQSEWLLGAGLGRERTFLTDLRAPEVCCDTGPYRIDGGLRLPAEQLGLQLALERRVTDLWWFAWLVSASLDRDQHAQPEEGELAHPTPKERARVMYGSVRLSGGPRMVLAKGPVELSLTTSLTAAVGWVGLKATRAEGTAGAQWDRGAVSLGARAGVALDRRVSEALSVRIGCGVVELNTDQSLSESAWDDWTVYEAALRPRASLLLLWSL